MGWSILVTMVWSAGIKVILNWQKTSKIIEAAIEEFTPLLSTKGIRIENKGITATIHYRLYPKPKEAEKNILATLEHSSQAKNLRILPGKMSINLLPPVEINKGTSVLELIKEYSLQSGIYLGDDLTDIDAFSAMRAASYDLDFQGFAIGITSKEMPKELISEVDFTLNGVKDAERFLKWLSQIATQSS